jgi:hypothetical protein
MQINASADIGHTTPDDECRAQALLQLGAQQANILAELRTIRQRQELDSKKINSIINEVDSIVRDLSEHIYGGPVYRQDPVNDNINYKPKDLV